MKMRITPRYALFSILALLFIVVSCNRFDDVGQSGDVHSIHADLSFHTVDDWNGDLILYVNDDADVPLEALIADAGSHGVALLNNRALDDDGQITFEEVREIGRQFAQLQGGTLGQITVRAATQGEPIRMVKNVYAEENETAPLPAGNFRDLEGEGQSHTLDCSETCRVNIMYTVTINSVGSVSVSAGCTTPQQVQAAINQALYDCFRSLADYLIQPCKDNCTCANTTNKTFSETRTCVQAGAAKSWTDPNSNCSITVTGPVSLTIDGTYDEGTCDN